jgi:hypothetical protein
MTEETKYNGWTNHATWAANLWASNDEGAEGYMRELAAQAIEDTHDDDETAEENKHNAACKLSDMLKEYMEENNPLSDACNVYSDLLTSALGDIDYYEWAEALLEE